MDEKPGAFMRDRGNPPRDERATAGSARVRQRPLAHDRGATPGNVAAPVNRPASVSGPASVTDSGPASVTDSGPASVTDSNPASVTDEAASNDHGSAPGHRASPPVSDAAAAINYFMSRLR